MRIAERVETAFEDRDDQDYRWRREVIGRRVNRLAQAPLQAGAQIGDLVVGSGAILVGHGREQLNSGGDIIADLFLNALRVINPDARCKGEWGGKKPVRLLSQRLIDALAEQELNRPLYLVRGLLLVVTRMIDLAIGIFATACAILSFGQEEEINGSAYEGLKVGRLLGDLLETVVGIIHPRALAQPSSGLGSVGMDAEVSGVS